MSRHRSPMSRNRSPMSRHRSPMSRHHPPAGRHDPPMSRHRSPMSRHHPLAGRHHGILFRDAATRAAMLFLLSALACALAGCFFPGPMRRVDEPDRDATKRQQREEQQLKQATGYRCTTPAGAKCAEPRFVKPLSLHLSRLQCHRDHILAFGRTKQRPEHSELVSLSPNNGALQWRRAVTLEGNTWSDAQMAVASDGSVVLAGHGRAGALFPSPGRDGDVVVATLAADGSPRHIRRLQAPPQVLGQGRPAMAASNIIYLALREKVQRPQRDETFLVLYLLNLDGSVIKRIQLERIGHFGYPTQLVEVGPDGSVWVHDHKRLIRCDAEGQVLDRYPLDFHRRVSGFIFDAQGGVLTASATNGVDNGSNGRDKADNKSRDILWSASPGAPLVQLYERVRKGRVYGAKLENAGGTAVLRNALVGKEVHRVAPIDAHGTPGPAHLFQHAGYRWAWCDNGDVVLAAESGILRQPVYGRSAKLAR